MFDIQAELAKLPQKPGTYFMKSEDETIIYIGKAKNLRNRVRQYFQASTQHNAKNRALVQNIASFEYIVTDTELEALILECSLIKKHRPKYNILLKDDKAYPYLKLTTNEAFPRLIMSRTHDKDRARYFGPFSGANVVHEIMDLVLKILPLRRCTHPLPSKAIQRACLNFHIGQCKAPCIGNISKEEYEEIVKQVIAFLNGKHGNIIKQLEKQMQERSEKLEFEKAAEIRDKLTAIKVLEQKQKLEGNPKDNQDIIAIARSEETKDALIQVFFVRNGKMQGREHFLINESDDLNDQELMTDFIKQFYGETTYIPKEIICETEILDKEIIMQWLISIKGSSINFTTPKKGEKLHLLELTKKNAQLVLAQFGEQIKQEQRRTVGALDEILAAINLCNTAPEDKLTGLNRIEAVDISNTGGYDSVGTMVVFEQGKPKRSDYRKFRIKTVAGPDDYKSIEEVVQRRFLRYLKEQEGAVTEKGFSVLPDAIFIDGGGGQVHAAERVLYELGLDIPVCGMVKDNRHRTRGLLYKGVELNLPTHSEGFKLVTRIQDEVHRFSIEYHRNLAKKTAVRSILDDAPGIGEKRRKALIKHFGSIESIKNAEINELAQVDTMNRKAAEDLYNYFRKDKETT